MLNGTSLSGLRVLVVEDEPMIAWALANSLESKGCEVVGPAYNLADATRLSSEQTVDGAVLDVNLGRDKVFPLADNLAERSIPFCFVTGYGSSGLRPRDLQRPILHKPIDPDHVEQIAQKWRRS